MDEDDSTVTRPVQNMLSGVDHRTASLIVLSGVSIGRMIRMEDRAVVIGRSRDAEIQLEDESISRHHVRLIPGPEGVALEELGSKNGTFLNGETFLGRATLKNGDKFQLGAQTVLRFSLLDPLDDAVQQLLYDASVRDGLTGAFNRRFFDEILQKEFAYSQRHDVPISLLMMDLDHFKKINDTWGHAAGDLALTQVVACINEAIRTEDALARIGGEEFALVLRDVTEDVAVAVAERLRNQVKRLNVLFGGQPIPLSMSLGVATHSTDVFKSPEDLLAAADRLLLDAKARGRNQVRSRWLE